MAFPNPLLVVISGPSGVGKSTIVRALAQARPQVVPIVTTTTRERRPYEVDGVQKVVRMDREPDRRIPVEDGELVLSQS